MSWLTKDMTQGDLNAVIKKIGGLKVARGILDGTVKFTVTEVLKPSFELYLHDRQKNGGGIRGYDLEAHLKETGLIDRCFSLEDEAVMGWLANPSTYPEEFKGKLVYLWKSAGGRDDDRSAPHLRWVVGRLVMRWGWLGIDWHDFEPALLAS